ncbi:MAG: type II toxin-antitoxin system RelE/ParE family toxin [Ramlibacter sp.]
MEIRFADKKLQAYCESADASVRKLGAASARKLRSRLADLKAAAAVSELVAGRPHPLVRNRAGQFSLDLAGGQRLVFSPAHEVVPKTADGSIDWTQVTIVCIVYIGDYHD